MRVISISGGRSSAMMLKIMADNGLQPGDVVVFANTGREDNATLDFVHECSQRWGIPVVWLEYRNNAPKYEIVSYETASRKDNPRPFDELLRAHKYLPNPTKRICTAEMKIKTIRRYIRHSLKHKGPIPTYIGLRFDEPERVARKKAQNAAGKESEGWYMPLYDRRITVRQRDEFWKHQGFDLAISSAADNCDYCFLKGKWAIIWKIREDPDAVNWWIEKEENAAISAKRKRNGQFRKEYSYKELKHIAQTQTFIPLPQEDRILSLSCSCTD